MTILVDIDVPDLAVAIRFYGEAFDPRVHRRFGTDGTELSGWPVPLFLLKKAAGTVGAGQSLRVYERHWTPLHLDVVVAEIEPAIGRRHSRVAVLAHPFGHGLCLIEFLGRGYDEVAEPVVR